MSESKTEKDYHLTEYKCIKCGQEIFTNRRPDPIHWTDDHVCEFEIACCLECSYWDRRAQEDAMTDKLLKQSVSKHMDHVIEDEINELNARINK